MSIPYKIVSIVYQGNNYYATGEYLSDGSVLVYKNAIFAPAKASLDFSGKAERLELEHSGKIINNVLQSDYVFSTAKACASALAGSNQAGKSDLRTFDGKFSLKEYLILNGLEGENTRLKVTPSLADLDDEEKETINVEISDKPAEEKVRDNVTYLPRNEKTKKIALIQANGVCGNSTCKHELFKSKNGRPYLEAHHLVPINAYKDFPNINIDIPENVVCLCPSCHKEIHFGENAKEMIESLYSARKKLLESKGIILSGGIKQLLQYYGIKD